MRLLCLIFSCRLLAAECLAVSGDQIRITDLARALPQFAAIPIDAPVGFAPAPGIQRVIPSGELRRIAVKSGIQAEITEDVCFQLETEVLTAERVSAALRAGVGDDRVAIEVLDFSRYPVPKGNLEFPRSGLTPPPSQSPDVPVLWRAIVRKEGSRSAPVWARVKLSTTAERVVAASPMKAGEVVAENQLRVESFRAFPFDRSIAAKPAEILGHVLRTSVRAGQALTSSLVTTKADVTRGEVIQITVTSATARLSFATQAESSASVGQSVIVRNPWSKQQFRAIVEAPGRGKVEVHQ